MSILNHLNPDYRPEDELPEFKSRCCMKYIVDKTCGRCPFKQIKNEAAMNEAMNICREKRRGDYKYHDEKTGEDIMIKYNNQYL